MLKFLKAKVVYCKVGKAVLVIDVRDEKQVSLGSINVGVEAVQQGFLETILEGDVGGFYQNSNILQSKLPLSNRFSKDIICLHPLQRTKISANPISRIAKLMSHVIPSSKILPTVE